MSKEARKWTIQSKTRKPFAGGVSTAGEVSDLRRVDSQHDARMGWLGSPVFLSNRISDARPVDTSEGFALKLAEKRDRLPGRISKTPRLSCIEKTTQRAVLP
jgi:hypothetical protein